MLSRKSGMSNRERVGCTSAAFLAATLPFFTHQAIVAGHPVYSSSVLVCLGQVLLFSLAGALLGSFNFLILDAWLEALRRPRLSRAWLATLALVGCLALTTLAILVWVGYGQGWKWKTILLTIGALCCAAIPISFLRVLVFDWSGGGIERQDEKNQEKASQPTPRRRKTTG